MHEVELVICIFSDSCAIGFAVGKIEIYFVGYYAI